MNYFSSSYSILIYDTTRGKRNMIILAGGTVYGRSPLQVRVCPIFTVAGPFRFSLLDYSHFDNNSRQPISHN